MITPPPNPDSPLHTPPGSTASRGMAGPDVPDLPSLTTPATLEALLSLPPTGPVNAAPDSRAQAFAPQPSSSMVHLTGTPAVQEQSEPSEPRAAVTPPLPSELPTGLMQLADGLASLLFIHAGSQESTLAQTWLQRMLGNSSLHMARFQDRPAEQAQQLLPHVVLVDFEPGAIEIATQLVAQLRTASPHLPLIAVGRSKHPQCMLAALRAGVQDFLDVDGSMLAAQQTMQDILRRSPSMTSSGPSAPLTAILSARGGLGCSLLASHLAWNLQQHLRTAAQADSGDLNALLIDLGHPSGDCSLYLNTAGEFDFLEAVKNLRRFDRRLASSGLSSHESGLRLLPLPRQSALLRDISYANIDALLQRLRQYFRHVVADLGAVSQTQLAMRVVHRSSHIWVLCDQSVASVVSTTELLQRLKELQIERERLQLIVCRYDKQLELDASQIARQLGLPLLATIPERRRELALAVNQGRLLSPQLRRDPYVQAVQKLTAHLLSAHHPQAATHAGQTIGGPSAGLLSNILQRIRRS